MEDTEFSHHFVMRVELENVRNFPLSANLFNIQTRKEKKHFIGHYHPGRVIFSTGQKSLGNNSIV